jgi:hypothetical protein
MKYLKLYEEFEEFSEPAYYEIPSNFVRLDSIGHVLDPEEGVIYAMWKKGGYDHENPYEVGDDESLEGVSDEDREIVDKYLLSCESFVKDKINWDLIQTAKDIALDYLDEIYDLALVSQVLIESDEKDEDDFIDYLVYSELFSHSYDKKEFQKWFPKRMKAVKSKSELIYRFWFVGKHGDNKIDEFNKEIFDRLKGMFPEENIVSR